MSLFKKIKQYFHPSSPAQNIDLANKDNHLEQSQLYNWKTLNWQNIASNTAESTPASYIQKIYAEKLDGLLIKNVLTQQEIGRIVKGVYEVETPLKFEVPFGQMMGKALIGADADIQNYLKWATKSRNTVNQICAFSFEQRILQVLQKLAGNTRVKIPRYQNQQAYQTATVRMLAPNKGGMRAHIGNEFGEQLAQCQELATKVQLRNQLSYFVVLQAADKGGELELYDLLWQDTPEAMVANEAFKHQFEMRNNELANCPTMHMVPQAGDMIVFAGGRIWHKVTDIEGAKDRITIGGFVAYGHDKKNLYFWC